MVRAVCCAASLVFPLECACAGPALRSALSFRTRLEEFFLHASGWIRGGPQHYPTPDETCAPLRAAGLQVRMEPLRGRTPFNSYLIVARHAEAA